MQRYELDWGDYGQPYPLARRMIADDDGEWVKANDTLAVEKERDELRAALKELVALRSQHLIEDKFHVTDAELERLKSAWATARALLGKGEQG